MASKITIKRSLTAAAPAGLSYGEMAFVQGSGLTANQLYVGISGGSPVWVGAQIGTTGTWTDNAAKTSLATQYATDQRIVAQISGSGVSSFNGLTGAVGGVTTSVANTFTAAQTFSSGISVGGGLTAVNINTTGFISINNIPATLATTTAGTANVFNTDATSLGIGGAATAITMGAQSGTLSLRNPTIIVGGTDNSGVATITTVSLGNTLSVSPYGDFRISPTSTGSVGGSRTTLIVTNPDEALGTVSISGGDLYLGTKTNALESITPVNIIFEGASANNHEITLTVTDPTADHTITLPDATGTVALTATSVASTVAGTGISVSGATGAVIITNIGVRTFNGATGAVTGVSSFNGLTGAVGGVTTSVANTFTALQTFSAGISSNGGTFGTPTQLVGTNITGTASGLTAGNVTTNANLTGAITSVGNGTTLGSFTSAHLRNALTDETGTGVAVFGTDPAITASLTTPSTSFDLLNTTATTVNFAGAGLTLNIGNASGTATFGGSVIVNGDFTVQGNTTTLNTTTLNVEDFNITMGLTLTSAAQCTGAGIGIGVGTGITFAYDHSSLGWLSSVNMDLASGKVFKINNASVLSATTLGSAIVTSSLTTVGTITSGTWSGSFGAVSGANLTNLTAGNLSGTIPSGVLANSTVYIGTTAVALNRTTASLALTGISIDGSAATVTGAAQSAITSVGTLTSLTVSGTLEAGLIDGGTF